MKGARKWSGSIMTSAKVESPSSISGSIQEADDPAVTTFAYSFTQTNLCGYPETIVIDNPTDFIIHNELD